MWRCLLCYARVFHCRQWSNYNFYLNSRNSIQFKFVSSWNYDTAQWLTVDGFQIREQSQLVGAVGNNGEFGAVVRLTVDLGVVPVLVLSHQVVARWQQDVCARSWWRGGVVSGVCRWTKLTHVGPGYYRDGWPSSGGYTISVCNQPTRSTQPCIPPGSLNRVPLCESIRIDPFSKKIGLSIH